MTGCEPARLLALAALVGLAGCARRPATRWEAGYGGGIPLRIINDSDYRVLEIHIAARRDRRPAATLALKELAPRSDARLRIRPGIYRVWIRVAMARPPRCEDYGGCLGADARVEIDDAAGGEIVFFRPSPRSGPTGRSGVTWRIPLLPIDSSAVGRSAAFAGAEGDAGAGGARRRRVSDALAAMGVFSAADCRGVVKQSALECESPDCQAHANRNPVLCRSTDCRAVASGNPALCSSQDCRGLVSGRPERCQSRDCRGLASGDKRRCESANCRALVTGNPLLCE